MERSIKVIGTGIYIPKTVVTAEELDKKLSLPSGWTLKKSGVRVRHFITNETASKMGAKAAVQAVENAGIRLEDIDCIISGSGTMEQPIPCNAALIQKELSLEESGIPCFDINTTCLSFVKGFDLASYLIDSGRYKTILIVSSEISSIGLNWKQKESAVLFGDGAAAVVVQKPRKEESSHILTARMETYSVGASHSEIPGGGTKIHPREHAHLSEEHFLFQMNGQAIFRLSSRLLPAFMEKLFAGTNITMNALKAVIPHQASGMALRILQKKLNIPDAVFINNIENYGNTIAASIPIALHEAIEQGRIKRGDLVMLIGTSAGLSIGGVIFEY
ncbi:beta-ketoacyl-ACP synthase III [Bacillus aquiflavi]|uniref:Beta-ketoacyl-ACP synthase III n=1 Tax=Bacillus aquiflavi TaxID=2672567 RepID=A0A6B3W0W0_9BACI|nr:beta-ketoacyl-ACP synthase III [Bacillus aquiflavi]MBA4537979.1 beta-ketoacyl-ACP synthase III [Bacillus aquiflavi]NEY82235.1 beta-ketoacyl-ACP synthase III [Bacillus aquiflavi]